MKEQKPIKEMSNKDFIELAERLGIFNEKPSAGALICGADRAYKVLSTLYTYEKGSESVFFVCSDEFEAKRYYRDFLKYLSENEVLFYPQESLYFTFADSISVQNTALRARVIRAASQKKKKLIVTGVWALCEKRLFPNSGDLIKLKAGKEAGFDEILRKIASFGYSRQDVCEAAGQFSVRGGIIDIFPINEEKPFRIEFFGDEVDSIRRYNAQTQLSEKNISSADIIPFEEVNITDEELEQITNELKAESEHMQKKLNGEQAELCRENAARLFSSLSENAAEVARLFYMYSGKPLCSVTELFAKKDFILIEPAQIKKGYDAQKKAVLNDFSELKLQNLAFKKQADIFLDFSEIVKDFSSCGFTALAALAQSMPGFTFTEIKNVGCADFTASVSDMNLTAKLIPNYLANEYKVIFVGENDGDFEKLTAYMAAMSLTVKKELADFGVFWQKGRIHCGLDFASAKVLLIPYDSSSKVAKKQKVPDEKKKEAFFSQIAPGDYVVHDNYGIGRYDGIYKITLDGTIKDYIRISYAKEDVLYVPPEQMDLLQKYIGPNESPPRLSNLGGGDWDNAKKKVSRAVKKLADEYLAMYAARAEKPGFSFSADTAWQSEFESEFRFEPTEGQLKASREIKDDMEKPCAMDRLLCGDVGYGKTEVAQRAAFKAVMDGKQVAVLVPTTILALQHYNNFIERFSSYPIKIAMLSRFVSNQKTEKVLSDLAKGSVDIVIGTHKLLGKGVSFKDLGLLVIDEEQRFGVAHKDKLKLLKENVDTLTLSATPIPRTLHMSLIGVKDMSVLDTPPANKAEIKTYVMERNDSVIAEAVKSELARDGQVFYLYNRVVGIERETERLKKLVPGARIEYAHGQMNEKSLEEIIMRFLNRETDVLVCTVIIENGVDFTNANTIIIDDADRLGLSQLYQLRGRVGRSDVQAYAYMMYKPDTVLTEVAAKRLAAIKEFTRFGSGFKIAMRDLQLRGAGEMLGANQHGHFANVGYEMYARLLTKAVDEIKGEAKPEKRETELDLKLDMYIPEEYIPSEEMRIEMYKSIAFIRDENDRDDIIDELIDRYGDIPDSVSSLVRAAFIKAKAINLGIKKIRSVNENVAFEFYPTAFIDPAALNAISETLRIKVKKSDSAEAVIILFVKDKTAILDNCEEMVDKMLAFASN